MRSVAVIGAGVAGLACARGLARAGLDIVVVEKARGVGGRAATRRAEGLAFDHGAQYFTARGPAFQTEVASWHAFGAAARWERPVVELAEGRISAPSESSARHVGTPGMSAIGRALATGLELLLSTRIEALEAESSGGWRLRDERGERFGPFDAVAIAAPAPQAAALLAPAPGLAARAASVDMAPCLAGLVAFATPLPCAFDGAFVRDSALGWAARNASKPGRPDAECWVLHATPAWSRSHLEIALPEAARCLLDALAGALGERLPNSVHRDAHRWRFALPEAPLGEACLWDSDLRLGACGDWCLGPRVEAAFESGIALAERMLGAMAAPP